jgi:hypothetical protein
MLLFGWKITGNQKFNRATISSNFNVGKVLYVSKGIEGIRHFWKSLGISRNALAIEEILELPRQLQKHPAFREMPRQLRKFEFNLTAFKRWEQTRQKNNF